VTLPYSREEFILPPNLYIIGTMNTADRSVEALDTALRRRFSFVEMLPNPSKLEGKTVNDVDLRTLLETMNERIEVLVDRDHTIGHAFLINIESIDELRNAFANKIIPLLQEYFYGNYRKMEMVIGSDFFNITDAGKVKFAVQSDDFDADGKMYQILNISDKDLMSDEAFIQALQKLMSPA
jgi:5-methylcytosine-specific restriction protein B